MNLGVAFGLQDVSSRGHHGIAPLSPRGTKKNGLGTGSDDPSALLVVARAGTGDFVRLARNASCLGWGRSVRPRLHEAGTSRS